MVGSIHDRMLVIVNPRDYDLWLDPEVQDAKRLEPLLVPYTSDAMTAYPVSTLVNNPRADDPKCIEPTGWIRAPVTRFCRCLRSRAGRLPSHALNPDPVGRPADQERRIGD
jgi:hypothetical protein